MASALRQLLLPQSAHLAAFFAAVPPDIEQLMFANHEALSETLEVSDSFEEVSLFKARPCRRYPRAAPSGRRHLPPPRRTLYHAIPPPALARRPLSYRPTLPALR